MLASIIISVFAGAFCLLFAILYKKKTSLRISLGIIGVILLFYGGFSFGSMNPVAHLETFDTGNKLQINFPVQSVQVISPVNGDVVKCRILTMGVYPENHNKDIWVLLKPSDEKFYPQSDYTNTSYKEKGRWQVLTRFGGDKGESYELYVFETDSLSSDFFSKTIANWKAANDYIGLELEELPSGAVEINKINVTLEGNCRGVH
ncbi:MAG: hypothetical protein HKO92_07700 [Flavobacteriaceae bacterium]|nr:hypothetical protein [Flavobacteriaceae bacterium]